MQLKQKTAKHVHHNAKAGHSKKGNFLDLIR